MKMAADGAMILARDVVESAENFATVEEAVGTGPFVLTRREQFVGGEFVRNLPYLDKIDTIFFQEDQQFWAAYRSDQLDLVRIPGPEVKGYLSQQGANFQPSWYAEQALTYWSSPNTTKAPFNDARVSSALKLLHDHEEHLAYLRDEANGRARNASIFSSSFEQWDLSDEEYYDLLEWKQPKDDAVKKALELLSAAGYSKNNPLKFQLHTFPRPQFQAMTELTQAQFRQLSDGVVDPEIKLNEFADLLTLLARGEFDYYNSGTNPVVIEPDAHLAALYRSNGSGNYAKWSDPRLDDMIDRQATIFDEEERKAFIKDIVKYYIETGPTTIMSTFYALSASKPTVRNFRSDSFHGPQYETVWFDA